MLKKFAIAAVVLAPLLGLGVHDAGAVTSFSNASLAGVYILNAAGPAYNDASDATHGKFTVTGVVSLDGTGTVTNADLNVGYGDSLGIDSQTSCSPTFADGSYFVQSDGTAFLTIDFNANSVGVECLEGDAFLHFNLALSRSLSGIHQLGLDNFGSPSASADCFDSELEIANGSVTDVCVANMSLSGKLVRQ
jgi:hypothetical protein